jgi:hypothetical protein
VLCKLTFVSSFPFPFALAAPAIDSFNHRATPWNDTLALKTSKKRWH